MTQKQLQKEWQKISFKTIENKPNFNGRYPSSVVKIRELLLLAQTELAKIETEENKTFHIKIYQNIMRYYQSKKVIEII